MPAGARPVLTSLLRALLCLAVLGPAAAPAAASVVQAGGFSYVEKKHEPGRGISTLSAQCPEGTHVYGGGHYNDQGFGKVVPSHSFPYDSRDRDRKPDDGWKAKMKVRPKDTKVWIYAICDQVKPSYSTTRGAPRYRDPGGPALYTWYCDPTDGHIVSGGSHGPQSVVATANWPYDSGPTGDGWNFNVENRGSELRKFHLVAICTPRPMTYPSVGNAAAAGSQISATVSCPVSSTVLAGGVDHGGTFEQVTLVSSRFASVETPGGQWQAWVDNYGVSPLAFTTWASCVSVP